MENFSIERTSLCVDSRATVDLGGRALVAQELVEGLGNHLFPQEGPLVLAHPQQELDAPFRKALTKKTIGNSWFKLGWERKFLQNNQIEWFHRFLPLDKVNSSSTCSLVTTLLPPLYKEPFFLSRRNKHHFVVPSHADVLWLQKAYGVPSDQITQIAPAPRHTVIAPGFMPTGERGVVVIRDGRKDGFEKHAAVIRRCFPQTRVLTLDLRDAEATQPQRWRRTLENALACFYLVERPLDWVTLAIEAIYWNIPTVYADANQSLRELIPDTRLQLHSYLADPPALNALETATRQARALLETNGVLAPDAQALAYRDLYLRLGALKG